jgi:hypothetical protein
MALRLNGSSSGYVELDVPAAAGSHTLTLPDGGGSSGQYLQTNGSGGLSWQTVTDTTTNLTWSSSASTSGTEIVFSSLPANVRRITIIFADTSQNSTNYFRIQVGHSAGTYITSGYNSDGCNINNGTGQFGVTDSFIIAAFNNTSFNFNGTMYLHRVTGNTWVSTSSAHYTGTSAGATTFANGILDMGSNVLDAVKITASGSTFDSGSIGFGYEV